MKIITRLAATLAVALSLVASVLMGTAHAKVTFKHSSASEATSITTLSGWNCTGTAKATYRGTSRTGVDSVRLTRGRSLWVNRSFSKVTQRVAYNGGTSTICVNVGRIYDAMNFLVFNGKNIGSGRANYKANYRTAAQPERRANYRTTSAALTKVAPTAAAAPYYFHHWLGLTSDSTIATYTDAGKNCTGGRKVLRMGQARAGVTCIRSAWRMDVYRNGASELYNVKPYTEVRMPKGGGHSFTLRK